MVAERFVVDAVAVNSEVVLASTVGVPDITPELSVNPVGKAFAAYVTPYPAALVALSVTLLIGVLPTTLYVVPLAGLLQVTTSVLMVNVKLRVTSCNSTSVAVIEKLYVVLLESTGAVPVITPLAYSVVPLGNAPLARLYVIALSLVATT